MLLQLTDFHRRFKIVMELCTAQALLCKEPPRGALQLDPALVQNSITVSACVESFNVKWMAARPSWHRMYVLVRVQWGFDVICVIDNAACRATSDSYN